MAQIISWNNSSQSLHRIVCGGKAVLLALGVCRARFKVPQCPSVGWGVSWLVLRWLVFHRAEVNSQELLQCEPEWSCCLAVFFMKKTKTVLDQIRYCSLFLPVCRRNTKTTKIHPRTLGRLVSLWWGLKQQKHWEGWCHKWGIFWGVWEKWVCGKVPQGMDTPLSKNRLGIAPVSHFWGPLCFVWLCTHNVRECWADPRCVNIDGACVWARFYLSCSASSKRYRLCFCRLMKSYF